MLELLLIIVVAAVLFIGPALIIRALARRPFYWTFTPANTFALIVTEEDESGDGMSGGGNVVNVLHAVPGQVLEKNDPDTMKWEFKDGEDPDHGFLFRTLGVQSMGNIFYTTRVNLDRRLRFAREKEKEELHAVTKVNKTRNVFYTGELTVVIKEADTADKLGLNFEIDFIFARKFPVRSVLRLADSAAFLTSLVEKIINNATVLKPAEDYIGGVDVQTNRENLIRLIKEDPDFNEEIPREIGLKITSVSLRDISMTPIQRGFLEMKVKAEKEGDAKVITAERERDAQIARNTGDADRVERVIKEIARDPLSVSARWADAHERNGTLTTVVYGGSNAVVPVGGDMDRKVKEK